MTDPWRDWLGSIVDVPELGFRLDWSRAGLGGDARRALAGPLAAAFDAMEALEGGAIANPDEGRRVGHYWLRDPSLAPDAETADAIRTTRERVSSFARAVHGGTVSPPERERFRRFLLIGIGGSALGPQLLAEALGGAHDPMAPHFLDNTDPDGFARRFAELGEGLAETLTVVISKSGGTPETRNGMLAAKAEFEARGLAFGAHACAVTGEGSRLDSFARESAFLEVFPMWDWVGGRTSVFSAVGTLPAALQGLDVDGMLAGAAAMDAVTRRREAAENPAAVLATVWHAVGGGRGARDMVILPYRDRLATFSRYLQQLVMESLGKRLDLEGREVWQGIAVYGNKGSTDQHAYVQQLRDGLDNFFATFVEVLHDGGDDPEVEPGVTAGDYLQGFLLGTRAALAERGRPSVTLTFERWDARTLGALIALYERAVGLYASMIGVNAYHQPGVEAGKRAAADVLSLKSRVRERLAGSDAPWSAAALAEALGVADRTETVFHLLEHLAANPGRGVERVAGGSPAERRYRRAEAT